MCVRPDFSTVMKFLAFFRQRGDQVVERRVEFFQLQQRRQAHGGGEDVVRRLPVVDVVVGMDMLVLAPRAAQQFRCAVRDDFIAVHVEADTRASLENVDHEMLVPLALLHFLGGRDDRVGSFLIDQAQFAIGEGRGFLHHGDGADERGMGTQPADGIVLHCARRLNAVINVAGNFLVAERIFFGTS